MNLEEFPDIVKYDIEDQSLTILKHITDDLMVIGGWAVRALSGSRHARYTLDIDGVTEERKIPKIAKILKEIGLKPEVSDWGIMFYKKYTPKVEITKPELLKRVSKVKLKIELSGPRIKELQTHHYFDFNLNNFITKNISYRNKNSTIDIKVPSLETMAAVKLGLPVDYKNNFDSAILLLSSNVGEVIKIIKNNDDWAKLVLRRLPKSKGRINDSNRLENMLLKNAGINVKDHLKNLKYIETMLKD